MKKFLTVIALFTGIFASAQVPDSLIKVTDQYNAKCPIAVADGTTLNKVEVQDGSVIFSHTVSDQLFDNLEGLSTILHDSLLAEMESSPDDTTKALVALCKANGLQIVQRFVNSAGKTFDITIVPKEL